MYLALLVTVAVATWRRRNYVLFAIGFIFPIVWLFGAFWNGETLDFNVHHHDR